MKPKIAFYWCAACGGCEECILDLAEEILPLVETVDIVFWPVAVDFKEKDIAAMPDGSIDVCFLNGSIRTTHQQEMAHLLRAKAKALLAFGACAQMGGIPGLANLYHTEGIMEASYGNGPRPQGEYKANGYTLHLPRLFETVLPADRVVPVDYYVPGCPPTIKVIRAALRMLLSGEERPPLGSVLSPNYALCEECPRRATKPDAAIVERIRRVHQVEIDQQTCLLAQGIMCLGPATRAGCEARCPAGNMPCTGCFSATGRVLDFGAKALSAVATAVSANDEDAVDRALEDVADPAGTFYRYTMAGSFLERKGEE